MQAPRKEIPLTLRLKPRSDEGERVGRDLPARRGQRTTPGNHENGRAADILLVTGNVHILQGFVHAQVNPGVRQNAQNVGHVAAIEGAIPFLAVDFDCGVQNAFVLAGFSESETGFQHLQV